VPRLAETYALLGRRIGLAAVAAFRDDFEEEDFAALAPLPPLF
jgi:hypothetical protein